MGLTYPSNKVCPKCGTGGYVWYLDDSEYVAQCTNCGHYFREQDFPMCVLGKTQKSITNADRIRAMNDEELAELLASTDGDFPPNCESVPVRKLEAYWLDWLKGEANK